MHARLRGPNNFYLFNKFQIKPDFPSLGDVIAKPRHDMNIKVAAFTVSGKFINTKSNLYHLATVILTFPVLKCDYLFYLQVMLSQKNKSHCDSF